MKFSPLNDDGPFETLFDTLNGCNVQITLNNECHECLECQIVSPWRHEVVVILFKGGEDNPTGEQMTIRYDDIEELGVH